MDEIAVVQAFRPAQAHDNRAAATARRALRHAIDASRRRRLTRPRVLVAAAVVIAGGATAAGASGLGDRVLDFVAGEPAPPPVQDLFDLQSRRKAVVPWLAQDPRYHAIASKAEGVLAIETSVGPVYLWVAPTVGGGECHILDIAALPTLGGGLGCSPQLVRYDYVPRSGIRGTRVGDRYLRLLEGRVAPDVASVEVRFTNGEKATIPTAKGFFLRELTGDEEPKLLIARDEDGRELGRHWHRRPLLVGPAQMPKPTGPYRTLISIETSWGYPMTFSVAPGENGTVCTETRYRGMRAGSCGSPRVDDDAIRVGLGVWNENEDGKPLVKLEGSVGRSIERLELRYRDGGRVEIPIVEGYVLFELPKDRVPRMLVGFDAGGSIVARRPLR
jgi:hypothetical protein